MATPTWGDFIEDILDRTGMDSSTLARKSGVTPSTLSKWRLNMTSAPGIDKIRMIMAVKEVQELGISFLDALVAASLITPEEAGQESAPAPARRTPLSEYSTNEIAREITKRLERIKEAETD